MSSWQKAKIIKSIEACSNIKSIIVAPEKFLQHKAGQHYEICLPGRSVIRKYSVVSGMHTQDRLEFGVQLIPNGALSPQLWNLKKGDELEIRGPLGESFVWEPLN